MRSNRRCSLLTVWLVIASSPILAVAQAGSLDPTFGNGGIVITPFKGENDAVVNAAAIQSDGKILVAGILPNSQNFPEPGVARYNTDGSLDSTFGTGGLVITTQSVGIFGIAVQSDGKIVAGAGGFLAVDAIRFNTNGTLDATFGTNGVASVRPFGSDVFIPGSGGLALEPSGKILVAAGNALVRFLANGQADSTFGTGGVVPLASAATSIKLLGNGNVLVASSFNAFPPAPSGTIAEYTPSGALNTSFALNGQISTVGPASAMTLLSGGKLLVAGSFTTSIGTPPAANTTGVAVTRFNGNGSVDMTFGSHGGAVTPFSGNTDAAAFAVAVQSNGDIVAAGQAGSQAPDGASSFALARFTSSGQVDTTFGTNGTVTTTFDNNTAFVSALLIQSDGKIVAIGNDEVISGEGQSITDSFALARYLVQ